LKTPSHPNCAAGGAVKRNAELFFPAEFADDFPVSLQISERFGLVYVVTKLGLLFVYDLETATAVYRNRISPDPIFLACGSDSTGGILAINRHVCLTSLLSAFLSGLSSATDCMLVGGGGVRLGLNWRHPGHQQVLALLHCDQL
jgi:hypothetical protein